jgi:ribosome biogenesis GTPase
MPVKGLVIRGSWNIFTVMPDEPGAELECRLKGKVLKGMEGYYNPLAPGDRVSFVCEPGPARKGLILGVEDRKNVLSRFNQKGQASQILAANVDLVLCVITAVSPPFRPRFLDRALLQADIAGILPIIVCNKYDLVKQKPDPNVEERLADFNRIGYPVIRVSALTGEGLDELRTVLANRFSVLLGQSGVGKSSLINALIPDLKIRVGSLNEKYNRGNHTTAMSTALAIPHLSERTFIIDTPGIRRFVPDGISAEDLILAMREFAPLAGKCTYGFSCSHRSEPGCKIMEAVAAGVIHEDRYESFLRIQDELRENR